MPVIRTTLQDLPAQLRRDVARRRDESLALIRRTVRERAPVMAVMEVEAAQPKPVDRGTYRRSFKADDTRDGILFYNYAPHAAVIEEGRRVGARMPPVDVIAEWVRRKLRVSGVPSDVRSVAFLIARAIKNRGLPAHKIMAKVHAKLWPEVRQALEALARRSP